MHSPVLFLVFNRPDITRQVFEAIRAAQPPRLYIAADGPREGREGEVERCRIVREIATVVDWKCDLKTLFREKNLGCKMGVSNGISWFFDNEEEGIILEDDVLPLPTFFSYCDELLEKYRDNESIGMISGCNLVQDQYKSDSSYFFSKYNHIWGWASWRRSWMNYDVTMAHWPSWSDRGGLRKLNDGNRAFCSFWNDIFKKVYAGKIDTWDYQWTFACWRMNALSILPKNNLVYNLGFDCLNATHTTGRMPEYVSNSVPKNLAFPLKHPGTIKRSCDADILIDKTVFSIVWLSVLKSKILNMSYVGYLLLKLKRIFTS